MNLIDKFKSKFEEGNTKDCWNWGFGVTAGGYGQMAFERKKYAAHRLSWSHYNNQEIPKGCVIMHKCDNPKCVNPNHLLLGTQKDNVKDMMNKGRFKDYNKSGENNPSSVVREKDVCEIYEANGTHQDIADRFGYPHNAVSKIRNDQTWKSLTVDLTKGLRGRTGAKGELNGKCGITKDMVIEIFQREGATKDLARFFLCSKNTVYAIKSGNTWSHVTIGLTKG